MKERISICRDPVVAPEGADLVEDREEAAEAALAVATAADRVDRAFTATALVLGLAFTVAVALAALWACC